MFPLEAGSAPSDQASFLPGPEGTDDQGTFFPVWQIPSVRQVTSLVCLLDASNLDSMGDSLFELGRFFV